MPLHLRAHLSMKSIPSICSKCNYHYYEDKTNHSKEQEMFCGNAQPYMRQYGYNEYECEIDVIPITYKQIPVDDFNLPPACNYKLEFLMHNQKDTV